MHPRRVRRLSLLLAAFGLSLFLAGCFFPDRGGGGRHDGDHHEDDHHEDHDHR